MTSSSGFVQTQDGTRLHYTQSGPPTGREILFVTGWRQTAAQWRKQVEHFQTSCHVTTYDHRGHGESDKPDFGHRVCRYAADLHDLLNQLHVKDVIVIAHSMGVSVMWAYWDMFPESRKLLDRLVLFDQSPCMVANPTWTSEQASGLSAIFSPEAVFGIVNDIEAQSIALVHSMFTPNVAKEDLDLTLERNALMSSQNAAAILLDHAFIDWRDVLPRINLPTLVIAAEKSVFPVAGVQWIATQIPGAQVATIAGDEAGSHFAFWENPDKFNKIVAEFLGS